MSGLQTNLNKQKENIREATAATPAKRDYVWDGKNEDERPLSKQEMRAGIKKLGGHPKLKNHRGKVGKRGLTIFFKNMLIRSIQHNHGWLLTRVSVDMTLRLSQWLGTILTFLLHIQDSVIDSRQEENVTLYNQLFC